MSYEIERATPCRVVVTATISPEEVRSERDHVLGDWLRGARIDGFRKGKAPRALVERRFANEIRDDLEEHLTRRTWDQVRREEKLRPASPLGIKESGWLDSGEYRFKGEFDVYPTVTLPALDGFKAPAFDIEPGEDEVAGAIEQLRERQAAWEPVTGEPVADGMLVEAEVDGTFPDGDGEAFHEDRSLFQLGRSEVYPEIEAAVTGKAVGDAVTVERTTGDEGGEGHPPRRVAYTVRIKSVRRKQLPEVDEAFTTSLGITGGVEALRERVRERLRTSKMERRRGVWREALVGHLADGHTLDLPEGVVRDETRKELVEFAQALAQRGIDPDQAKVDWEKIEGEMRDRVEQRLRAEILLDALAESLGITVSAAEIDHEVEHQAQRLGVPFAELRGNLAKGGGLEQVGALLRRERAVDEALKISSAAGA
jgi:trigger factor